MNWPWPASRGSSWRGSSSTAGSTTAVPLRTWLSSLASGVRSIPVTPAIATTAVTLGQSFPADPADRLIYATAVEHGLRIVTKDERLHRHPHPRAVAIW